MFANTRFYKLTFCHVYFVLSGGGNMVAIDLIVQHVHSQLEEVRQDKVTQQNIEHAVSQFNITVEKVTYYASSSYH